MSHVHVFQSFDIVKGETVVFRCSGCGVFKTRPLASRPSLILTWLAVKLGLRRVPDSPETLEPS